MNKTAVLCLVAALILPHLPLVADHDPALTTVGAERSGNIKGTIPPWTGGITAPPGGYSPGDWHPNPYQDDQVLFTINSENVEKYSESLTAGHLALIEKYPDTYHLNIYPARRSASHPQSVLDQTLKYSGKAKIVDGGAGIAGIVEGVPFPHPQNGEQAIWNARLSYKAGGFRGYHTMALTSADGDYDLTVGRRDIEFPYSDGKTTLEDYDNVKARVLTRAMRPAKKAGRMIISHRYLNSNNIERRRWTYDPGKRRIKRASNNPRDMPEGSSEGIHVWDQEGMWRGPITDFNWALLGKREFYVPYNAYQLHDGDITADDIIQAGHVNQRLTRYELHRVWVVEANLKEGRKHLYSRRRYYIDEDSWRILAGEHFNSDGTVDRFSEAHTINYYEVPLIYPTLETYYKLDTRRYFVTQIDNQYSPYDFSFDRGPSHYGPGRLKMKANR
jgi:hypothetical protein